MTMVVLLSYKLGLLFNPWGQWPIISAKVPHLQHSIPEGEPVSERRTPGSHPSARVGFLCVGTFPSQADDKPSKPPVRGMSPLDYCRQVWALSVGDFGSSCSLPTLCAVLVLAEGALPSLQPPSCVVSVRGDTPQTPHWGFEPVTERQPPCSLTTRLGRFMYFGAHPLPGSRQA